MARPRAAACAVLCMLRGPAQRTRPRCCGAAAGGGAGAACSGKPHAGSALAGEAARKTVIGYKREEGMQGPNRKTPGSARAAFQEDAREQAAAGPWETGEGGSQALAVIWVSSGRWCAMLARARASVQWGRPRAMRTARRGTARGRGCEKHIGSGRARPQQAGCPTRRCECGALQRGAATSSMEGLLAEARDLGAGRGLLGGGGDLTARPLEVSLP